jgi:hypothetical protein
MRMASYRGYRLSRLAVGPDQRRAPSGSFEPTRRITASQGVTTGTPHHGDRDEHGTRYP